MCVRLITCDSEKCNNLLWLCVILIFWSMRSAASLSVSLWKWWELVQTFDYDYDDLKNRREMVFPWKGYKIVQAPQNGFVATTLLGFHYVWPCPEVWTHRIIDPKLSDPWYPWNKIHGIHGLQLSFTMFHLNGPVGSPTGPNPWRLFLRCGPSTFSMLGERWQSRSSVFVHSWSGSNVG